MKTKRNTLSSSNSNHIGENKTLPQLPFDLIVKILAKVPAKSIARFRCLSKVWASTLITPYFTNSFLTISLTRPKLLFTCLKDGETFFFSSPQPQPQPQNVYTITPISHMKFPINCPIQVSRPVCSLVCGVDQQVLVGRTVTMPLICNPSTGRSLRLPRVKTRRKNVISYLGYDPISTQFKMLCMTLSYGWEGSYWSEEHQVMTIEAGKKLSWRMTKCEIPHRPVCKEYIDGNHVCIQSIYDGVCINGVVYYLALLSPDQRGKVNDIVCFDIKYEKFSFIKKAIPDVKKFLEDTLVNYKGKLAKLRLDIINQIHYIHLWVLDDAQKHQWSSYIYELSPQMPLQLGINFAEVDLRFVGMTDKGEIVMSSKNISDSFYLLYYNPDMNTTTRVEIQGMEAFKPRRAYIFLDYVENVASI